MDYETQREITVESSGYIANNDKYIRSNKKCTKCKVENFISCEDDCVLKCNKFVISRKSRNDSTEQHYQKTIDDNLQGKLHEFVIDGDFDAALELLNQGADPCGKTRAGPSLLYFAVENDCPHLVERLIDSGADVNEMITCFGSNGEIPILHFAVYLNRPKIVQQLLHSGADASLCDSLKCTALHLAAEKKYVDIARLLLIHGIRGYDIADGKGDTPLLTAARWNSVDVFHLLMNYGVDIDQRNTKTKEGVVHVAASKCNDRILSDILEYGAEANALDDLENTPIHCAIKSICQNPNNIRCYNNKELLLTSKNSINLCPNVKQINTVIYLLKKDSQVNSKNSSGQTPLLLAVENNGCHHVIDILLHNEADIDEQDKYGNPVLHKAIINICKNNNNSKCTKELKLTKKQNIESCPNINQINVAIKWLKFGAKVNSNNINGRTPLHLALEKNGCKHVIQMLLDNGANSNIQDNLTHTSLHSAIEDIGQNENNIKCYELLSKKSAIESCPNFHQVDIAAKLIKHGANVNLKDYFGETPLQKAIMKRCCKHVINILLNKDADVNIPNKLKYTALHVAVENITYNEENNDCYRSQESQFLNRFVIKSCINFKHINTIIDLLKFGAKINVRNINGHTPLHIALRQNGCNHLIQILLDKKANANIIDEYKNTSLHTAVEKISKNEHNNMCHISKKSKLDNRSTIQSCPNLIHIGTISELYKHGAKFNVQNKFGRTPLHTAIDNNGCKHLIQILIEYGADVNVQDKNGNSPLHKAVVLIGQNLKNLVCCGNKKLHSKIRDVIELCPNSEYVSLIADLLKYGANINAKNQQGETPFYLAIQKCTCKYLIKIFLDNGADINTPDPDGNSILHKVVKVICKNDHNFECQELSYSKKSLLESCPNWNHINTTVDLWRYSSNNINLKNLMGKTLLHLAILNNGCNHLIQCLIDAEADVNASDKNGDTPLHYAVEFTSKTENNGECCKNQESLPIKRSVRKNCLNKKHINMVLKLLTHGAECNSKNNLGWTPLHIAARNNGCLHLLHILIVHGADVNALDEQGHSPLHSVFLINDSFIYQYRSSDIATAIKLLRHGANVNLKDKLGNSLLQKAIETYFSTDIIEILLDKEAEVNATNEFNKTPLEIAVSHTSLMCVVYIVILLYNGASYERILLNNRFATNEMFTSIVEQFKISKQIVELSNYDYDSLHTNLIKDDKHLEFKKNCIKEVENMKSEKLIDNTTIFQFLYLKSKQQLAYILWRHRYSIVREKLPYLNNKYPIYYQMLRRNWAFGRRYAPVYKKAVMSLGSALNHQLPLVPLQKIISFLNFDDMKIIIRTINEAKCSGKKKK